jgi:hypothetical protein
MTIWNISACSLIQVRLAGRVARMGEEREVYKVLVRKPEGKRPFGRPRRRWEDGTRMDRRGIGLGCVDWIRQGPVSGCCECGDELSGPCPTKLVSLIQVNRRFILMDRPDNGASKHL